MWFKLCPWEQNAQSGGHMFYICLHRDNLKYYLVCNHYYSINLLACMFKLWPCGKEGPALGYTYFM